MSRSTDEALDEIASNVRRMSRVRITDEILDEIATKDLLPCPFCNFQAKLFSYKDEFCVVCQNPEAECNARIPYCQTREEAVQQWNRRVP